MSTNKDIMEAAIRLKELLVRDQKYEAAKGVRDIERAYLEKVNTEPVTGERVYAAEQQLINVGNAVKCIEEGHELLGQRIERDAKEAAMKAEAMLKAWKEGVPVVVPADNEDILARLEKLEKAVAESERKHGLKSYFDTYTADEIRALYERVEKMEKALSEHMAEGKKFDFDFEKLPSIRTRAPLVITVY